MNKKIVTPKIPKLNLISKTPHPDTDNNMDLALNDLNSAALLKKMGFKKRSGDSIEAILYTLFLMPLLQVKSICFLFGNPMTTLLQDGKEVIYSFMENQSINWSLLILKIAYKFYNRQKWRKNSDMRTAISVDDTLVERYGKKVEATSLHWDHIGNLEKI